MVELKFCVMAVLIPFLMSLMLCYAAHVHIPARLTRPGQRKPMMMDDGFAVAGSGRVAWR